MPALLLLLPVVAGACDNRHKSQPPVPEFDLTATGALPPNSAIASIGILGERSGVALMNSFGTPFTEVLIPFDPLTGAISPSVTARQALTFAPPLPNTAGQLVSTTTTSLPAFAAFAGSKLFVTTNNLNAAFAYNPGTVLVYDYDGARNEIGAFRSAIVTAAPSTGTAQVFYNPTWITPFTRPGGTEKLAVVCAGPFFGTLAAAVVVIDPLTETVAEAVTLGATTAGTGESLLAPDFRLYIGSATRSEIYVVNLATSPPTVERDATNPIAISTTSAFDNNVSDLATNADGSLLLVLNSNDGAMSVLSRATPSAPTLVTRTAVFKRSKPTSAFDNSPFSMAVRPGRPGIDFRFTPDVAVATIGIRDAQDQVVANVQTAVDSVTTYTGTLPVKLNALVSPFTPFTDLQHLVAPPFGRLRGYLYAVEGNTGRVVVRHFDELR